MQTYFHKLLQATVVSYPDVHVIIHALIDQQDQGETSFVDTIDYCTQVNLFSAHYTFHNTPVHVLELIDAHCYV